MLLEGIFLPVTTPFHPDGRLYGAKLEANIDRYGRTGAAGLLLLGDAGEPETLTTNEAAEVLRLAIGAAAPAQVMVAAVGREGCFETLALAETAATCGYDALAIGAPRQASASERRLFLQVIADRAHLPVVLVSSPARELPPELVAELAAHPNVLGVIDAAATGEGIVALRHLVSGISRDVTVTSTFAAVTGRMQRQPPEGFVSAASLAGAPATTAAALPALKTRTKRVGFAVLSGATSGLLAALEAGASGAVPAIGAAVPQACGEIYQAFRDGDPPLALAKQNRVTAALPALTTVAALKYGCDFNSYFGGVARLPRQPLLAEGRRSVEQALQGMRN